MGTLSDRQIEAFGFSIVAFLVIVSVHVLMLHRVAAIVRRRPPGSMTGASVFGEAAFVVRVIVSLFSIQFVTNVLWGGFIQAMGVVPAYKNALFYSLENYTSLGLTRVQVDETWRALAPLISLSGVFCLGWSTAILASVFGRLYATKPD